MSNLIESSIPINKLLIALNSDKIQYANLELREIINNNIGYCDGIGAVWAAKRKGLKDAVKIAGCDLWLEIIKKYPKGRYYLVGASEEVIHNTVRNIRSLYPEINIVGYRNGFFESQSIELELINNIVASNPDFVFAAMGSPRQEYFLNKVHKVLPVTMMGLGGSFNVFTGAVRRAPHWMISLNLESLYRYFFAGIKFARIKSDIFFLIKLVLNKF